MYGSLSSLVGYDKYGDVPNLINKHMNTAREILKKYEDDHEFHLYECDRKWIIKAMEEYAEQFNNNSENDEHAEPS